MFDPAHSPRDVSGRGVAALAAVHGAGMAARERSSSFDTVAARVGAQEAAAKLAVLDLSKRYGDVVALDATDLLVQKGEFLTLLGPSGSGKTTLLQMICGLVAPSSGQVVIDGVDHTRTPVHQRDIGLVFQHYALFPHLSVHENVAFPLRMRNIASADVERRVEAALDMVKLGHLGGRLPRELSGGQQQRVALARCFIYEPSIILMDEPLGALDKKLREHLQIEIRQLHRQTGSTIIYVTHDQEEALALSDRICLMNQARIEQIGTPQEVYANPVSAFAADFIGTSNIVRGKVADGKLAIRSDAFDAPVGTPPHAFASGDEVAVVVRPEKLRLDGAGENRIAGVVADCVYAGADTKVIVNVGRAGHFTVRAGFAAPPPGSAVTVSWNAADSVVVRP
ncbi:MAG TPA: ABC transporter ATP-binding protein [Paraburkholderia sp.]|jgi:putative spermidine/putrescine transport system ATP-binding protein